MAKANDKSSTIDWVWLRDALALSVKALGSVALAKELLRKWLAAGKLPWSCTSWKGLDAEGIAWLEQESRVGILSGKILFLIPSTAYHQGDPQFWLASLTIDWEDNLAGENAVAGAKASGVKVSRNHLLALLPEEPRERVEELGQTKPAEPELLKPAAWFDDVRKDHPRLKNEPLVTYAGRLHALMQEAKVTKLWTLETLLRRFYEK